MVTAKAEVIREADLEKKEERLLNTRWRDVAKAEGALKDMQKLVDEEITLEKRGVEKSGIKEAILGKFRAIAQDISGFLSDTQKSQIVFNQIVYYRSLLPKDKLKMIGDAVLNELSVAQRRLAENTNGARETLGRMESDMRRLFSGLPHEEAEDVLFALGLDASLLRKNFLSITSALETEKRVLKDLRKVLKKEEIIV